MTEELPEDNNIQDVDFSDLHDFGTGIHVITLTYNNNDEGIPHLDLGDCSPWVAITLFRSAIDSLSMMIPPIDITFKGDVIVSHMEIENPEDEDYD